MVSFPCHLAFVWPRCSSWVTRTTACIVTAQLVHVRRYCNGLLATMNLRSRHDLLYLGFYLVEPRDDTITLEVYMNDRSMPPTVLAVGMPKSVKQLLTIHKDLSKYAMPLEVDKSEVKDWPAQHLAVYAESPAVFYALFCKQMMELAFNSQARSCCYQCNFWCIQVPSAMPLSCLCSCKSHPRHAALLGTCAELLECDGTSSSHAQHVLMLCVICSPHRAGVHE
jgi:hypothetical protein